MRKSPYDEKPIKFAHAQILVQTLDGSHAMLHSNTVHILYCTVRTGYTVQYNVQYVDCTVLYSILYVSTYTVRRTVM